MSVFSKGFLLAGWIALVATGFGAAWRYEATAGKAAPAGNWPKASAVRLANDRPTIILFAHPSCPCTRATLEELSNLVASKPGRAKLYVLIVQPTGLEGDPLKSTSALAAAKIPEVTIAADPQGADAKRFGAATSGQVVVFAPSGTELFRGGITAARGHLGPNAGIDAIAAILDGQKPAVSSTPVFGCSLLEGFK